jgi:hypothetical protein
LADAAVEGMLELLVDDLSLQGGAVLEDGDDGHPAKAWAAPTPGPLISPCSRWNRLRALITGPR